MRDLATKPQSAYHHLGSENGQAFIGLIADFKAALFAGDVPGEQKLRLRNGDEFEIAWYVFSGCTLQTVIRLRQPRRRVERRSSNPFEVDNA